MTQRVVALGGLGDVYLVAALFGEYQARHPGARLVVKPNHLAITELFGIDAEPSEVAFAMERDPERQRRELNDPSSPTVFWPHPCMLRTPIDLTPATTVDGRFTQARMFRLIMGLPIDVPLALPRVPAGEPVRDSVMLVQAHTWPDTAPGFTERLADALRATGREVWINDGKLPLRDLLARAARTEWVIGAQCGLMSIFVAGRWPCRKTIATPDIDNGKGGGYWAASTFPYAAVQTFSGMDFDIEELRIGDDYEAAIGAILTGPNALRLWEHNPAPVVSIQASLSPGDFLDRYAVLLVKAENFDQNRRAAIARELQRATEIDHARNLSASVANLFFELIGIHAETFHLLAGLVSETVKGVSVADVCAHTAAINLNKRRFELKTRIDEALHGTGREVKSYYAPEDESR